MRRITLTCVVGARPNFIKMAAILAEVKRRPVFDAQLIHTGQHSSPDMSDTFFRELEIPAPNKNLEVCGGSHTVQTAEIMRRIETVFEERRPDVLLVVGDVNSTLAAALVAAKMGISIAHVEAGLRSLDRTMPEEVNRILTDSISDALFVTEPSGERNLLKEGVPADRIFFVGNVMIDTLLRFRARAAESRVHETLGLKPKSYILVTMHRPSNVDNSDRLRSFMQMLGELQRECPIVFPAHPRTLQHIERAGISQNGVLLVPPQSYLDFMKLTSEARLVMTDSGGVQEETTILGVPCLTMRDNTERPVTIDQGTNHLVGTDPTKIYKSAMHTLQNYKVKDRMPDLWDGHAASRVLDVLENRVIATAPMR